MLTEKQVKEIRTHLEKAQNPLFFFDNDPDGLCSYLLLRRAYGKGKGIPVRSFPDLNVGYFRRIEELNSDYVFILDKPIVSEEFLKEAEITLSKNELLRRLPKQIMRQTLNVILDYLEEKGVIMVGEKGVLWIHNESPKMRKLLKKSVDAS